MKLLVLTQKVDRDDPILGFFHRWLEELAGMYDSVTVVALGVGRYDLPHNVRVLSLGKEKGRGRVAHVLHFYRYVWTLKKEYDAVFVHMNQEYILLAGWLWKVLGKRVYMWRNHFAGNFFTDMSALWCTKVFATSADSYTARYKKTVLMPVGIDTDFFAPDSRVTRIPHSLLSLGRIAPSKRLERFLLSLRHLSGIYSVSVYGDPLLSHRRYYESLKDIVAVHELPVSFFPAVSPDEARRVYASHEIFINCSPGGMFDKTIFEAGACETLPLSSNINLEGAFDDRLLFEEGNEEDMARKIEALLELPLPERDALGRTTRAYIEGNHSLRAWGKRVYTEMKS